MLEEKGVSVQPEGPSCGLLLPAEMIIAINAAAPVELSFHRTAFCTQRLVSRKTEEHRVLQCPRAAARPGRRATSSKAKSYHPQLTPSSDGLFRASFLQRSPYERWTWQRTKGSTIISLTRGAPPQEPLL